MEKRNDHGRRVAEISEDATGFGEREFRTLKDLLVRPREALEHWMIEGPTGGGRYARPIRFYLTLCGLMTLLLLIKGGATLVSAMPPEILARLAAGAGKSIDSFAADAENWLSIVLVPVSCVFYALVAAPLLRWWDPDNLGWRRGSRAAFAFLSAWTIPVLPLTWWSNEPGPVGATFSLVFFAIAIVAFVRMGRGRWWRTPFGAAAKSITLTVALFLSAIVAMVPILAISYAAAFYIE
jgi:hypothetical protein